LWEQVLFLNDRNTTEETRRVTRKGGKGGHYGNLAGAIPRTKVKVRPSRQTRKGVLEKIPHSGGGSAKQLTKFSFSGRGSRPQVGKVS